ncbi:MAG: glycosyltransferase family 4 protein [Nibricoccus sp.]
MTPSDHTHPDLRGKRAAVILYSSFPSDPRPNRAAEAMAEAGMTVDVLCLAESEKEAPHEKCGNISVYRIPMRRRRESKLTYLLQYGRFLLSSFWFLTRRSLRKKYDIVHVHNMPDFLVFAALVPRLQGTRVILDIHDPMPELMVTIYGLPPKHWFVRILRIFERLSIGFAHLVLTPNIAFKTLFISRSTKRENKIQIVMNSPQEKLFDPDRLGANQPQATDNRAFRIMHHGSIVHRHGIDLLVEAIARVRPQIPGVRLDIYGNRTPFVDTVLSRAQELGVSDIVAYHGPRTQGQIAELIRECNLGVVPNRRSVFTDINFPTRLFEYLSMHRPVIAPSTQGIRDYFSDEQMMFFKPEDVSDLAERILWVYRNPQETSRIVQAGIEIYRHHLWSQEKSKFISLVGTLMQQ